MQAHFGGCSRRDAAPDRRLVLVVGHTDNRGEAAFNRTLSQRRAEAVGSWLMEHGLAPSRLTAKGLGETQPVADTSSAAGRRLNRRVEIVVAN